MESYEKHTKINDGWYVFSYDAIRQHELEMRKTIREILGQKQVIDVNAWCETLAHDLSQFTD